MSGSGICFKKQLRVSHVDFRKVSEQMVEESSFSHGVSIDELEETENLITVEQLDSFLVVYERKKAIIIIFYWKQKRHPTFIFHHICNEVSSEAVVIME